MVFEEMVKEELIFVQKNFKEKLDVIKFLSEELREKGFVKESFCDAVIERENKFPTGLYLGKINVAIPHADIKYVNKPGIAIATLQKPILFKKMDDPILSIPVHIVFLLALVDPNEYVKFLSSLTRSFSDESFISLIYSLNDTEILVKSIRKVIKQEKGR